MTVASQIQKLRRDLTQFRKENSMPYWRLSYVEFLLERATECIAVKREPEAAGILKRIESWFVQNQPKSTTPNNKELQLQPTRLDVTLLESTVARVRSELQRKRQLVPGPDREAFENSLTRVEHLLDNGQVRKARSELENVRTNLIRRLQRSYRARSHTAPLVRNSDGTVKPSVRVVRSSVHPVGPYNNQRALEDVFDLVGERDPIWIEDFGELFHNLQGFVERLGNPDKNMRKPGRN
jgi:hypothetical protein